uniref:Zgc:152670 n=1 Tax=Sinocyclocheilus anshuiensis TaxID=1608454 RepID=A0A671LUI4_9TELE
MTDPVAAYKLLRRLRNDLIHITSKRQRALSCRYSTGGGNPRLIYAPVKEEVEWDEPRGVSKIRTSQSVFLEEGNTVVARVNQRIADITGLSMKSAEDLQVQNYGIGGRYEPHYDAEDNENERIATFLLYMSDVSLLFKGSAVFWYNLHKNGNVDLNTEHARCPVLRGNKWVANKWIHEFGQEFRRPCSLSYWE